MSRTTFFIFYRIINTAFVAVALMLYCDSAGAQSINEIPNYYLTDRNNPRQTSPYELPEEPLDGTNRNATAQGLNSPRAPSPPNPFTDRYGATRSNDNTVSSGSSLGNGMQQQNADSFDSSLLAEERERRIRQREINPALLAEERAYLLKQQESAKTRNLLLGNDGNSQQNSRSLSRNTLNGARADDANSGYDLQTNRTIIDTQGAENQTSAQSSSNSGYNDYSAGDPYFEEDPYQPLGIRVGSFLFFPGIQANTLYSDNVFLTDGSKKSDVALELRPAFRLESQWGRHQLVGEVSGSRTYYKDYDGENEENVLATVNGRIDVTSRTSLDAEASYSLTTEGRDSIDVPDNADGRSKYKTGLVGGGINHRFNRLSIGLRGTVSETDFDDVALDDGTTQNNDDRDYREVLGTLRLGYEFHPGKTVFVEGQLNERTYNDQIDDSGFRRGSKGVELRGGLGIDIGPKIRGEFSVGYTSQNPEDPLLSEIDGVVVDADLTWRPNAFTTWHLVALSEVEETAQSGISGILNRSVGLDVRHALRRHFILTAGAAYLVEEYDGSDREENTLTLNAGAEYIFNRSTAIVANYQFTDSDSTVDDDSYQVNEFRVGVRLRR